jgi:molybdate transport system ATP-binding protein
MMILDVTLRHEFQSGFDLDVRIATNGGVTALCGPSGSGKTSILHAIAGIFSPQSATVQLKNRTLLDTAAKINLPPEQRQVGIVFQERCLFPHLTVRQNLEYGLARHARRRIDFDHVVKTLQIEPHLARMPRNLSGGEKQRVALGRALLASPELLLLDEPLSGLEEPLQEKLLEFLRATLAEFGLPTLLVSHDPRHLEALADRIIRIENGRVVDSPAT